MQRHRQAPLRPEKAKLDPEEQKVLDALGYGGDEDHEDDANDGEVSPDKKNENASEED